MEITLIGIKMLLKTIRSYLTCKATLKGTGNCELDAIRHRFSFVKTQRALYENKSGSMKYDEMV